LMYYLNCMATVREYILPILFKLIATKWKEDYTADLYTQLNRTWFNNYNKGYPHVALKSTHYWTMS
jgi:hypothetical protein